MPLLVVGGDGHSVDVGTRLCGGNAPIIVSIDNLEELFLPINGYWARRAIIVFRSASWVGGICGIGSVLSPTGASSDGSVVLRLFELVIFSVPF